MTNKSRSPKYKIHLSQKVKTKCQEEFLIGNTLRLPSRKEAERKTEEEEKREEDLGLDPQNPHKSYKVAPMYNASPPLVRSEAEMGESTKTGTY